MMFQFPLPRSSRQRRTITLFSSVDMAYFSFLCTRSTPAMASRRRCCHSAPRPARRERCPRRPDPGAVWRDREWAQVRAQFPPDLEGSARASGALRRRREVRSAAVLLRLGLAYALSGMQGVAHVTEDGWIRMTANTKAPPTDREGQAGAFRRRRPRASTACRGVPSPPGAASGAEAPDRGSPEARG